jgi:hypothetical protein
MDSAPHTQVVLVPVMGLPNVISRFMVLFSYMTRIRVMNTLAITTSQTISVQVNIIPPRPPERPIEKSLGIDLGLGIGPERKALRGA